jgi:glycosyltransferase involved in cell wall biosynthesis
MKSSSNFLNGAKVLGSGLYKKYELLVVILSFNQEQFLAQAIESAINQNWGKDWHIVIHDDSSKDDSRKIINEFYLRYNEKITAILQETNRYSLGFNIPVEIQDLVDSKFVARLDGDDFYISKDKLVKQVAIMNEDPNVNLVSHSYEIYDGQNELVKKITLKNKGNISNFQLLAGNPIATPTAMYRASCVKPLPAEFTTSRIQDWPLWVILGSRGQIRFIPGVLSGYRIHSSNGFALRSNVDFKRDNLCLHEMLSKFLLPPQAIYWKMALEIVKISFRIDKFTRGFSTTLLNKIRSTLMGYKEKLVS